MKESFCPKYFEIQVEEGTKWRSTFPSKRVLNTEKKPLNQITYLGKYLIDSNFCLPTISNDGLWNQFYFLGNSVLN